MKKLVCLISVFFLFSCNKDEISNTTQTEQKQLQEKGTGGNEFLTSEQARIVAINFFSRNTKLKAEDIKIKSLKSIHDYNRETAVYSVNIEPAGFVLVSSNARNIPVIAFSEKDSFVFGNDSPDGLKSWIAESIILGDELEKMDKPIIEIQNQWADLGIGSKAPPIDEDEIIYDAGIVNNQFGPLLQTIWGQGTGYNDLSDFLNCSSYSNGRAPSGCVATATAQVMKYHQWPSTYNWTLMPNNYGTQTTSILMRNIGDNIGMSYSCSGSGAQVGAARDALVNVFGYSAYASYSNYNINTTALDIKNNRPVIMDGFHTQATNGWWFWEYTTNHDGHAWVCDGFKETYIRLIHNPGTVYEYETAGNYTSWLHMNWGWNGAGQGSNSNNGWFSSNQVYVNGVQILVNGNAVNPNFQYNRKCIYNIRKP